MIRPRPLAHQSSQRVALTARLRHVALLGTMTLGLLTAYLVSRVASPESALAAFERFPATPAQAVTAYAPAAATVLDGRLPPHQPDSGSGSGEILLATTQLTDTAPSAAPRSAEAMASAVIVPMTEPVRATPVAAAAASQATPSPVVAPAALTPVTVTANRYATRADLLQALARTQWDPTLWNTVINIAFCESGVDTDRDGIRDVVDTRASGAGGTYLGVLQIGRSHHFSVPYDLRSLVGNLAAGHELWIDTGRSFAPWGCR